MFKEKFANNLRTLRKSNKLTQEQLAEMTGVDFRYISLIENAKSFPSCDVIERLSVALKVTYSELFVLDDDLPREELEKFFLQLIKNLDNKSIKLLYNIARCFK